MNPNESPYRHVVLFKFREETPGETVRGIEGAFREFAARLPIVIGFEWGRNSSPEHLDLGFTHCFIVTFRDPADRDAYLIHPAHKAFCRDFLDPNLDKVCVVDFRTEA